MRISLLVLFSVFSLWAGAQKYQPIDSTMMWSTEEVGKNMASCYIKSYCKYYLKGYELNNGRAWSKVYRSYYSQGVSFPQCTTYTPPPPVYNAMFGYVNNDTLNKIVYFVDNLPLNFTPTFTNVAYDFNKTVGDTMYFKIPSMASMYKFPISSIDSVLFSGKYHKRFFTNCYPSAFYLANTKVTFVEGIGSSLGAFTHTVNGMGEYTSNLVCFASPTQTMSITNHSVYTNSSFCNTIALGISKNNLTEGIIFPNPASNYFIIQNGDNSSSETEYEVYNSLGQIQIRGIVKGQKQINTETLSSGVYFIKLSSGPQTEIKKLLIQKE